MTASHTCGRCGESYARKDYLVRHLHRKRVCEPLLSDVKTDELLAKLADRVAVPKSIACEACNRMFRSKGGLRYHRSKHCAQGLSLDRRSQLSQSDLQQLQSRVQLLQEQLDRVSAIRYPSSSNHSSSSNSSSSNSSSSNSSSSNSSQSCSSRRNNTSHNNSNSNNTTTNTTTTTTTIINNHHEHNHNHNHNEHNNVIIVNSFGKESVDHITGPFLDQCLRRRDKGLLELLEKIHFDPAHQENLNVRATNVRASMMHVHDGTVWRYERKSRVLNDMVDKGHGMMQEHLDDHEDRIRSETSEYMFQHIQEWMEKMQGRDKQMLEDVLLDIYVLILNSSSAVGRPREEFESL